MSSKLEIEANIFAANFIIRDEDDEAEYGIIRHFAFETDDVDSMISKVRSAGYEVFISPKDISVPFNARVAFCFGPLGEQVELIQVKG